MWASLAKWLFGSAMGRGVLLGGSISLGMALGWYVFSTHYFNEGAASCQAGRLGDTNAANVAQGEKNAANNRVSSEIAKATDVEAAKLAEEAEKAKQKSEETVHDVYKKPPVTAPVAVGSCVHPLDERVQDRITEARIAAAKAGSP